MTLLSVEVPERLMIKLHRTGRSAQEVVVEALEQTLNSLPIQNQELTREEVEKRLLQSGFVSDPADYDSPAVHEWEALSEEERQEYTKEMEELFFPTSPASNFIIESRQVESW